MGGKKHILLNSFTIQLLLFNTMYYGIYLQNFRHLLGGNPPFFHSVIKIFFESFKIEQKDAR